tara:strand:+ start:110 stop:739 length:630 start_codon:yes stop_codon:yes gene_type:complete
MHDLIKNIPIDIYNKIMNFLPIRNLNKDNLNEEFKNCLKRINYNQNKNIKPILNKNTYFLYELGGIILQNKIKDYKLNHLLINKENEKKILDSDINTLKLYIFNIDEFQSLVMEIPYNIERDPTLVLQKYKKSNYINQYKILECLYNYIMLLYLNKDNIDYLTNTYYYLGKYAQIEEIRSSKINEENKRKLNILIIISIKNIDLLNMNI